MRSLSLLLFLLFTAGLTAQPVVAFENLNVSFSRPVDVTNAGDGTGRLFVVESAGSIIVYDPVTGLKQATPFLDISSRVDRGSNEQGLLGLAFHPNFPATPHFYVHYISNGVGVPRNNQSVISRFSVSSVGAAQANASSEVILLIVDQPRNNHNAGDLAFGPDGYLYIPFGDSGGAGDPDDVGQDGSSLLGKMLRIDVDNPDPGLAYGIPTNNPFVGEAGIRDEIWALGLRNPWRISFDRATGDLWIGDVGQSAREEVDFQPASSTGGENYGWDCREGKVAHNGPPDGPSDDCVSGSTYVDPVFDYPRSVSSGGFSITGGFVYRGPRADDLLGHYICADYLTNNIFIITPDDADGRELIVQNNTDPISETSSFGEGENGDLYVLSLNGPMYRVTSQLALPVTLTDWRATVTGKTVTLNWTTSREENAQDFVVERSGDGIDFLPLATVPAGGRQAYTYLDQTPLTGEAFYRLRQRDLDGQEALSPLRRVVFQETEQPTLSPNPAREEITLFIPELRKAGVVKLRLVNSAGQTVFNRLRTEVAGPLTIRQPLPELPAGVYRVVVDYDGGRHSLSLVVR
ncbi:MAG: PQQ-dependent sugar dehydrogenase [Bacteroidota bacterium]